MRGARDRVVGWEQRELRSSGREVGGVPGVPADGVCAREVTPRQRGAPADRGCGLAFGLWSGTLLQFSGSEIRQAGKSHPGQQADDDQGGEADQ